MRIRVEREREGAARWPLRVKGMLLARRKDALARRPEAQPVEVSRVVLQLLQHDFQRLASQQTEAPLNSLEREHVRQRVREGLEEISEEHRAVLLLRDIEGLDYDEIAETLELTRAAVKSRLHRARLEMARILRDLRPEPRTATVDGRT